MSKKNLRGWKSGFGDCNFGPSYFAEAMKTISSLYEGLHISIKES